MQYNPDPNDFDQILDATLVEYLGSQPARNAWHVVAILTLRPSPATSFESCNISITHAQVIRLRDDLTALLATPGSWLNIPMPDLEDLP